MNEKQIPSHPQIQQQPRGGMSGNERFQQHLAVLNMRAQNVNLAFNDFLRDISTLSKAYADRIAELEQENANLKSEQEKTSKTGKP